MTATDRDLGPYCTRIYTTWAEFEPFWQRLGAPVHPFQSDLWLRTWFGAFSAGGGDRAQPVLAVVQDRLSGDDVMGLPLVRSRVGRLDVITFADFSVTDCNAPRLRAAAPQDAAGAGALWASVRAALPPADVIHLDKMPARLGQQINPLTLLDGVEPCVYSQNLIDMTPGWPAYLARLDKYFRKELGRSQRLFEAASIANPGLTPDADGNSAPAVAAGAADTTKVGGARFRFAATAEEGRAILALIDACQLERLGERGVKHVFDDARHQRFYDQLAAQGAGGETVLLSALELDGTVVAGLMMLACHPRVTLIRIGQVGGDLARIGLGRLIIERSMKELTGRGYTSFDLSIGEGDHKRRFGAEPEPLWTLRQRMTWRALPTDAVARVRQQAKSVPALRAIAARLKQARLA